MMAKKFNTLKGKLSSQRRAKIDERIQTHLKEMPLQELRQALKLTQEQVANSLDMNQAAVSKVEHQTDMFVSTLRRFIDAMGGSLEIVAHFPQGNVVINQFNQIIKDKNSSQEKSAKTN